jgi:hypothetical protein
MVRSTRAGLCDAPGHRPLNQRHGRVPKRNHPAGATTATNARDLRDWTRATSLPAADGDRTPTEFPADYERLRDGLTWTTTAHRFTGSGRPQLCAYPLRGMSVHRWRQPRRVFTQPGLGFWPVIAPEHQIVITRTTYATAQRSPVHLCCFSRWANVVYAEGTSKRTGATPIGHVPAAQSSAVTRAADRASPARARASAVCARALARWPGSMIERARASARGYCPAQASAPATSARASVRRSGS